MTKTPKKKMVKMYSCCKKVERISGKWNFASFIHPKSWVVQDAAIKNLVDISCISELLLDKNDSFCFCHPEIPFRELSGIKRYLTKVQDSTIDFYLIWNTIGKVIPDMIDAIEAIFEGTQYDYQPDSE